MCVNPFKQPKVTLPTIPTPAPVKPLAPIKTAKADADDRTKTAAKKDTMGRFKAGAVSMSDLLGLGVPMSMRGLMIPGKGDNN